MSKIIHLQLVWISSTILKIATHVTTGVDLCYKYINKITTQDCSIAMGNLLSQATEICRSGDTRILARNYTGASAAITWYDEDTVLYMLKVNVN